jgi:hypothetical protein
VAEIRREKKKILEKNEKKPEALKRPRVHATRYWNTPCDDSSAQLDTLGVTGSSPVAPTNTHPDADA